uniref:Uncharacterized protein n=2 Tax=Zeugodacus cucurbitae TaxID=28588 RepID=A0A0A1X482_ZEUCU
MDTSTLRIIDIVSYVHKKYGSIEVKSESNKTKIEILDIVGANPPKRIKVEALKYGSQGTRTSTKRPNMQPFSAPPFQRYGRPNGFHHNIFQHCATRPSQWFKPQQPIVKLNINKTKIPGISVGFPLPTFNFNTQSFERVIFTPTTGQQRILSIRKDFPNAKPNSNCLFFSKSTQTAPDSTTTAKQTPNKKKDNKEETLEIGEGVLEASLLQREEGLICTPHNKFLNAQSSLISNMPQGVIKLLNAQEPSPKFPYVKITRPSPLIIQKLKERQMSNKMKSCGANVNMDT